MPTATINAEYGDELGFDDWIDDDLGDDLDLNEAFLSEEEREKAEQEAQSKAEASRPAPPWETEAESPAERWVREGFAISHAEGLRRGQAVQDYENSLRGDAPKVEPVSKRERAEARQKLIDAHDPEKDVTLTPFEGFRLARLAEGERVTVRHPDAPPLTPAERHLLAEQEAAERGGSKHVAMEPQFLSALARAGSYDEAMSVLRDAGQLAAEGSQIGDSDVSDAVRRQPATSDEEE